MVSYEWQIEGGLAKLLGNIQAKWLVSRNLGCSFSYSLLQQGV